MSGAYDEQMSDFVLASIDKIMRPNGFWVRQDALKLIRTPQAALVLSEFICASVHVVHFSTHESSCQFASFAELESNSLAKIVELAYNAIVTCATSASSTCYAFVMS